MITRALTRLFRMGIGVWRTIDRGMRFRTMLHTQSPFRCTNFTYGQIGPEQPAERQPR